MDINGGYNFSWKDIGDISEGRPNLGMNTRVEIYRLMQYTMRAVLDKELGEEMARDFFVKAGKLAGAEFCLNIMDCKLDVNEFIAQLHAKFLDFNVGLLRIERFDKEKMEITLTISEDLDCSGLPIGGGTVCDYDEGFLEGVFEVYMNRNFKAKEVDCWATGERTCRFEVKMV